MIYHCFAGEAVRLLAVFLQTTACEFAQGQDSVTFLFSPEGRKLVSGPYHALDKTSFRNMSQQNSASI